MKIAGIALPMAFLGVIMGMALQPLLIPAIINGGQAADRVNLICFAVTSIIQSCVFNIYPAMRRAKK